MVDEKLLRQHIQLLTETVRPAESAALERCRQYAAEQFESYGWHVARDEFATESDNGKPLTGISLIARRPDFRADAARFIVGAHIDSREESPGADDNASAVAALLEIARLLPEISTEERALEIELVAFDLEEEGMLGGAWHAKQCRQNAIDLRGMVSLEMLGYCDHTPGSQSLPKQLVGLYPDTGDFIAVIGNQISGDLINSFQKGMQQIDGLPVEKLAVPENGNWLQATRLSDHSPFWDEGFAALMITDTSFMRNPHYHQASDTIETLDFDFLTKVTAGSLQAVSDIVRDGLSTDS